jgi:sugar lactone lactonase YvrE
MVVGCTRITRLIPTSTMPNAHRSRALFRLCTLISGFAVAVAHAQSSATTSFMFAPFAGDSSWGSNDGQGSEARFFLPRDIATDPQGNVYVISSNTVRKITPSGLVTTVAGTPSAAPASWDPIGPNGFIDARGLVVDATGDIYLGDYNAIQKITPGGVVSTVYGDFSTPPLKNQFTDLVRDSSGTFFYPDLSQSTINTASGGTHSVFVGKSFEGGRVDGIREGARFHHPERVALDGSGNVYVTEWNGPNVRKITRSGTVTTLPLSSAVLDASLAGLGIDAGGNLLIAALRSQVIAKSSSDGPATLVAGQINNAGYADGAATLAQFLNPTDVAADHAGNLYVTEENNVVRKITPDGQVSTFAGMPWTHGFGSVEGIGRAARFGERLLVAVAPNDEIIVADANNRTVRKISTAGVVTTLAGKAGEPSALVDGRGETARFRTPGALAVSASGNTYILDEQKIRKITPDGTVTTLSVTLPFADNRGIAVDALENIYVSGDNEIQRINQASGVSEIVARFSKPSGMAIDRAGNIYVADTAVSTIHRIASNNTVSIFAGTPGVFGHADGNGSDAQFGFPWGLAVDAADNLFVTDHGTHTIRMITPSGTVSTVAGLPHAAGNAGGAGAAVRLFFCKSVAVDRVGNLYFPNFSMVYQGLRSQGPVITVQPRSQVVEAGTSVSFAVAAVAGAGTPMLTYQWYLNGSRITGATANTLDVVNVTSAVLGDYTVVVANAVGQVTSEKATLSLAPPPPPSPVPGATGAGGVEAGGAPAGGAGSGGGSIESWFALVVLAMVGASAWREFRNSSNRPHLP